MLVWTRSLDDWSQDKKLFENKKDFIHLPAIKSVPVRFNFEIPKEQFYLAFTSSKASDLFLNTPKGMMALKKAKQIFALGAGTASPLIEKGFEVTVCNSENGTDFHAALLNVSNANELFLLPGGRERAFLLDEALKMTKRSVLRIDIYETTPNLETTSGETPSADLIQSLARKSVVCFASPSAVKAFQQVVFDRSNITAVCIGRTTADAARNFASVKIAEKPTIENLAKKGFEMRTYENID